jgi:hypothetical protein
VADELYLAVPARLVHGHELADGWGLLWVHENLEVTVEKEACARECLNDNRVHLVQNIAAVATRSVLFAQGVTRRASDKKACLVKVPRGHRQPQRFHLS